MHKGEINCEPLDYTKKQFNIIICTITPTPTPIYKENQNRHKIQGSTQSFHYHPLRADIPPLLHFMASSIKAKFGLPPEILIKCVYTVQLTVYICCVYKLLIFSVFSISYHISLPSELSLPPYVYIVSSYYY